MPPHSNYPGVENISLIQLCQLPYKEQAIWFMNAYWNKDNGKILEHAEEIWGFTEHFIELDNEQTPPKGEDGNELDQFFAAKFLEDFEQTLTAVERKAAFREIDADSNGKMALVEYLIYRYKKSVDDVVNAPQGAAGEIAAANKVIDTVMSMLPEIEAKIQEQKEKQAAQLAALQETRMAKANAEDAYNMQLRAEADLQQAVKMLEASKVELEQAVKELHEQEEAVAREMADLEAKSNDMSLGQVARGKAANMLISLRNEDPLPLRKAKITQEAALRRVEREQKRAADAAEEAKRKAEECKKKAEELEQKEKELEIKKQELAAAIAELEKSYEELQKKMSDAQAVIVKLKDSVAGLGAVWWMERQLFDVDFYLPQHRRKYDHTKPFQFKPPAQTDAPEPMAKFIPNEKPALPKKPTIRFKGGQLGAKRISSGSQTALQTTPNQAKSKETPSEDAKAGADVAAEEEGPFDATLYYFPAQGRAEQLRLALVESGLKWTFKPMDKDAFMKMKPELLFGQLPMLDIDGMKLVQSAAALRYLARRSKQLPTDSKLLYMFDAIIDAAEDMRAANYKAMPSFSTPEAMQAYKDSILSRHLTQFNALLSDDNYFVGNKFTFADLTVFNTMSVARALLPTAFSPFPKLVAFIERIAARPKIQAYTKSQKCFPAPEPMK